MGRSKRLVVLANIFVTVVLTVVSLRVKAEEFTVTESKAILYTVEKTGVYAQPDYKSTKVTTLEVNVPVDVLGITSNGWFQVNIEGTYYIPGMGLAATQSPTYQYHQDVIKEMVKGTFSFYPQSKLKKLTKKEIEEMTVNDYLKYLDSFLMGNADLKYCYIRESGLYLTAHYDGLAATDAKIAAQEMKYYLVDYRNEYLQESLTGPARTKEALIQILNRSIRYDIDDFTTIYKNSSVGSDEKKMMEIADEVVEDILYSQGISYDYTLKNGNYTSENGTSSNAWYIHFVEEK